MSGPPLEYGLVLPAAARIADVVAIARRAEERGLDGAYCVEAWRSAPVPVAAVACATSRIKVGTYILNAHSRSPFLAGLSAIDLDELSHGRLVLCLGTGNKHINEAYQGLVVERTTRKMTEYVELLHRIVSATPGQPVSYDGQVHRMKEWPPIFAPYRPTIPINLAAVFPPMRKVAGRVADGVALGILCSPAYVRDVIRPAVEQAAAAAGRDPAALRFMAAAFVAVDHDLARARDSVRRAIAGLFAPLPHPYYSFLLGEHGFGEVTAAVDRLVAAGRIEASIEAIPDELVDTVAFAGSLERCVERLRAFEGVVDEIVLCNAKGRSGPARDPATIHADYDALMGCATAKVAV